MTDGRNTVAYAWPLVQLANNNSLSSLCGWSTDVGQGRGKHDVGTSLHVCRTAATPTCEAWGTGYSVTGHGRPSCTVVNNLRCSVNNSCGYVTYRSYAPRLSAHRERYVVWSDEWRNWQAQCVMTLNGNQISVASEPMCHQDADIPISIAIVL